MEGKIMNLKTAPKTPRLNTTQQKIISEARDAAVMAAAMSVAFFFRQLGLSMSEVLERNTKDV